MTLLLPDEGPLDAEGRGLDRGAGRARRRALTRARRSEREHDVALALQRSLLPRRCRRRGLELAGRYSAGGVGLEVGGDWYDAVRRPDGIVHLTVGDVAGRGIAAAMLMGQLRNAFRALAYEHTSPAEIAQRMLRHVPDAGMATAVFLTLDPYTGELAYASAGHPPTLLLDVDDGDGHAASTRRAAPPLGWAEGRRSARRVCTLRRTLDAARLHGRTRRAPRREHRRRHRRCSRRCSARTPERSRREACDRLLEDRRAAAPADDDMALLLVG